MSKTVVQSRTPSAGKARPFLKWAGGKSSLVLEFSKMGLIPKSFNDYYEPFLGGGAVFFYLYNKGLICSKAYLTDVNKELVNTYNEIKTRPDQLIEELKTLEGKNSQEFYKECRNEFNAFKKEQTAPVKQKTRTAALMIYLNKPASMDYTVKIQRVSSMFPLEIIKIQESWMRQISERFLQLSGTHRYRRRTSLIAPIKQRKVILFTSILHTSRSHRLQTSPPTAEPASH